MSSNSMSRGRCATTWKSLLGALANVLPITPGGMGVGEAAAEHLFGLLGLAGGAALIVTWRLSALPVCVLGVVLSLLGVRRLQRTLHSERVDPAIDRPAEE